MSAIRADHSLWAEKLFDFYINRLMNKTFHGFYHFSDFPLISQNEKLIVTPNHFSWWDGFFMYRLKQRFISDRKLYLLMLESQLRRFWFFSKVGAYSIDPGNPKKIIDTINYTSEILSSKDNFVIIFPQGEIEPHDIAGLNVKRGITKVIERSGDEISVLPVAFKIVYGEEKNPAVFSVCGEKLNSGDIAKDFNILSDAMNSAVAELKSAKFSDYKSGIKY